jgi:hypothetical protein
MSCTADASCSWSGIASRLGYVDIALALDGKETVTPAVFFSQWTRQQQRAFWQPLTRDRDVIDAIEDAAEALVGAGTTRPR